MSLRMPTLNHRVRLTGMLTLSVSVALAAVFFVVIAVIREQTLSRRLAELEVSVARVAHEWSGPDSLNEEKSDFPWADFAVYDRQGKVWASTTTRSIPSLVGTRKVEHDLVSGIETGGVRVVGATSWRETEAGLKQLAWVLAGLWLPLTLLTAGIAWYGGGLVLRPVTELVTSAGRMSSWSDEGLLETTDQAEFGALATSLNEMIGRVRHAAQVQEQFASDAAHELRSPLAVLQTRIEATLLNDRSPEQYQASLRAMLVQVERLTTIIETLLVSAREAPVPQEELHLAPEVREIVEEWQAESGLPSYRLLIDCSGRGLVSIMAEELRIVVRNLLDNAARYSPSDHAIEVCVADLRIEVRDFGPGLNAEARLHAFERFYRADEARDRRDSGVGIGLAVVKRIVESRGGRVGFDDVEVGTLVWVDFNS